jgi:nondiscriminating glutamyl-tRNA synthetase
MATIQTETGVKGKDLWMPVRVALTGSTAGPELPEVIQIMGKQKILEHLDRAIDF